MEWEFECYCNIQIYIYIYIYIYIFPVYETSDGTSSSVVRQTDDSPHRWAMIAILLTGQRRVQSGNDVEAENSPSNAVVMTNRTSQDITPGDRCHGYRPIPATGWHAFLARRSPGWTPAADKSDDGHGRHLADHAWGEDWCWCDSGPVYTETSEWDMTGEREQNVLAFYTAGNTFLVCFDDDDNSIITWLKLSKN